MKKFQLILLSAFVISAGSAWATSPVCPSTGYAQFCNEIITISATGTVSVATSGAGISATPYDGDEDQLIGVVDNWAGHTVTNLGLTGTAITDFDGDGANSGGSNCVSSGSGIYGCNGAANVLDASHGNTGYAGFDSSANGVTNGIDNYFTSFTNPGNSATINFAGGLTAGETAWFSLEEPATAGGLGVSVNVPEPTSVVLFGTLLLAAAYAFRRRLASK